MEVKEVIDKLQAYYLTQDPKIVARCLAGLAVDVHRWVNFERMTEQEAQCLEDRWWMMSLELLSFVKNGASGDLAYINISDCEF